LTTPSSRTGISGFDQLFSGRVQEGGRVRTGITELDEMLHGGFMEGDAVMVAGSAGCGTTTLALQYLVNGVKLGEPGVITGSPRRVASEKFMDLFRGAAEKRK